jgi:hypothetical protein
MIGMAAFGMGAFVVSAEGEIEDLNAQVRKLDLKLSISNGHRLPDQLIQTRLHHDTMSLLRVCMAPPGT